MPGLWILLLLAGAYAGIPFASFQFDDFNVIVFNPRVATLAAWWDSLPGLRMLLKFSYALNAKLDAGPLGFHAVNVLLHMLNSVLVWRFLAALLRQHGQLDKTQSARVAFLAALFWALHPAQTEAVSYIAGRSVSLMSTFMLLALLAHTANWRHGRVWTAVFAMLALATRETAWILPLALLLTDRLLGMRWQESLQRIWPTLAISLLAASFFLLEPHHRQMLQFSFALRDASSQALSQLAAYTYLLGPALFSLSPNIDPEITVPATLTPTLGLMAIVLLAMFLAGMKLLQQGRLTGFALLWLLLQLLPTNSIFPRADIANDRHLYLALLGPVLLIALAINALWTRPQTGRSPVAGVIAWLLAGLLFTSTLIRNGDYQSELALWARTVQQSPAKARAWNNLGMAAQEAGQLALARAAFERALALAPEDSRIRLNLYFLEAGDTARADQSAKPP